MKKLILIAVILVSCGKKRDSGDRVESEPIDTVIQSKNYNSVIPSKKILSTKKFEKIKLLVIQCSNGYYFSSSGYDFNPIIERSLKKFDRIEVVPFSYKKLLGVTYQGVYDKKYCKPILEKIEADYFIMTRFIGPHPDTPDLDSLKWGYETKILNTKTLHQKVSIGKSGLKVYEDIEKDIANNIDKLVKDVEDLK